MATKTQKPVSYTHLDVYKRQTLDDSFKVRTKDVPEGILLPANKFIVHKYKAVSYTHLPNVARRLTELHAEDMAEIPRATSTEGTACLLYTSRCV